MNLKDAPVVFDGVCRHIPQKVIGSILQLSSIRRISFTTPPDRCAALVEQAKALYSEFVGAPDRGGDPAFKSVLRGCGKRLSKMKEGYFEFKGKLYSISGNYNQSGSDGTGKFRRTQKKCR